MKKLFTLLAGLVCTLYATAATFTFTSAESVTQTIDGYTVKIEKGGSNNAPAYYDNGLRLYASNTITVSGGNLDKIELTFSMQGSKAYADLTASTGNLVSGGASTSQTDLKTDIWTGSESSVTFTLGASGQRLINKIVVNGNGAEGGNTGGGNENPSGPTEPDSPSLNPDYVYAEPTSATVPSFTVQGAKYSFVSNNIQVSCSKGAITESYFSAHAGFAMTFTATKNIKGLVINGFVKKDFTATADHGKLSYLTPGTDTEANPVIVITDVNSKSVTIDCVKQLRCYNVEVYFDENPEATVSDTPEITLNFDSADAVYESEYSDMIDEPNYSIYLFNAASPIVPYFALDIFPPSRDHLAGTYTWDDLTLGDYTYYVWGYNEEDLTRAEDGEVTITKSGNTYTITGWILCDNGNTYKISFTGPMDFYTDDEYYGQEGGDEIVLSFDSADAVYESEYAEMIGEANYSIFLYNEASPEIPYFALDIYPASKDNLAGTYIGDDWSLGEYTYYVYGYNEEDLTWMEGGEVTITKSGNTYIIKGVIFCDDGYTYIISFTGPMDFYTDDEYYGGGDDAVEEIRIDETAGDTDSPAFDLQGRRVSKSHRGIVIRGGKKVLNK